MKVAVITGGSKGIGLATVRKFLSEGWGVATCSRTSPPKDVRRFWTRCDISKYDEVEKFAQTVKQKYGKIDVLINNAGILGERVSIKDYPVETWIEVINTNVNGMFFITKAFLPMLKKGGVVVNVSSGVGVRPAPFWGAYAVSKWATEGFSKLLAKELEGKAVVYSFNPGGTRTEMRRRAYPDEDPSKLPEPEKVANVLFKLCTQKFAPSGSHIFARDWF